MKLQQYLNENRMENNPHGFSLYSGPQRNGNSAKAWRDYILIYLEYLEWKHGKPKKGNWTWYGSVGDGITKNGLKVIEKMAAEGIIEAEIGDVHLSGQPIKGPGGRIESWGGSLNFTEVKIRKGKKFPNETK
jgi:hypothetical protein